MEQHQSQQEILDRLDTQAGSAGKPAVLFDLARLRTARRMPQKLVAANLGICQSGVVRFEDGRSLKVETLQNYIRALGGQLVIAALFENPDGTASRYLLKTGQSPK
jgi:transcriptional regulator with XRE-family HTH domain